MVDKIIPLEKSLLKRYPDIAREWNFKKNGELLPEYVYSSEKRKVWWKCSKGHEWQTTINHRSKKKGTGCPYCKGRAVCKDNCLATVNPKLAKEWHPEKNVGFTPYDVIPGSHKKVWWKCEKGHEWQAVIKSRHVNNCPYCSGWAVCKDNCLATVRPKLAKEWHPEKNEDLTAYDVTPGSNKKVWWKCEKGHEWQTFVYNRSKGINCPFCSGRFATIETCLATVNPSLAKQWHPVKNEKLTPSNVKPFSHKKVWWQCNEYQHEWQTSIMDRSRGRGCPHCYRMLREEGYYNTGGARGLSFRH